MRKRKAERRDEAVRDAHAGFVRDGMVGRPDQAASDAHAGRIRESGGRDVPTGVD